MHNVFCGQNQRNRRGRQDGSASQCFQNGIKVGIKLAAARQRPGAGFQAIAGIGPYFAERLRTTPGLDEALYGFQRSNPTFRDMDDFAEWWNSDSATGQLKRSLLFTIFQNRQAGQRLNGGRVVAQVSARAFERFVDALAARNDVNLNPAPLKQAMRRRNRQPPARQQPARPPPARISTTRGSTETMPLAPPLQPSEQPILNPTDAQLANLARQHTMSFWYVPLIANALDVLPRNAAARWRRIITPGRLGKKTATFDQATEEVKRALENNPRLKQRLQEIRNAEPFNVTTRLQNQVMRNLNTPDEIGAYLLAAGYRNAADHTPDAPQTRSAAVTATASATANADTATATRRRRPAARSTVTNRGA